MEQVRKIAKRVFFGPSILPQKVFLGRCDPQSEVDVWLHGPNKPVDVTHRHMIACPAAMIVCIGIEREQAWSGTFEGNLALRFRERGGEQRLLGEIGLRFVSDFLVGDRRLCLFGVAHCRNYCLPLPRLWAHYLLYERDRRRSKDRDVPVTPLETRALIVYFLCPRPIVLVTVEEDRAARQKGNMFPMNLMGPVGPGYFAFALNSSRAAAPIVERVRRVVLSTVPLAQAPVVSRLGSNHRKLAIEWSQLPFETVRPATIDAPVAAFAVRVREMQVEVVRPLGSHTLFVAKVIAEERLSDEPQLFSAHGMYAEWLRIARRQIG